MEDLLFSWYLPGKNGIFHSNLRSIFQCHWNATQIYGNISEGFSFPWCIVRVGFFFSKFTPWKMMPAWKAAKWWLFVQGRGVDGSEIPRSTCLDGGKTLVNNGISTTFPSTGEFTGFLNHPVGMFFNCQGCKFSPCFNPILSDQNLRCAWVQWRVWRCRSWCNGPRRNGHYEGPHWSWNVLLFSPCFGGVFLKLGGGFKYFLFLPLPGEMIQFD